MNYFGLDRHALQQSILKHIFENSQKNYLVLPTKGTFILHSNEIVYRVNLGGRQAMLSMSQVPKNATLEELNGEYCVQSIVKKNNEYDLLISLGDSVEEAKQGLEEQIVEHYVKSFQLQSKMKLKKFLI